LCVIYANYLNISIYDNNKMSFNYSDLLNTIDYLLTIPKGFMNISSLKTTNLQDYENVVSGVIMNYTDEILTNISENFMYGMQIDNGVIQTRYGENIIII